MNSEEFFPCNPHFNQDPELASEKDLSEPTRKLSKEELDQILKDSFEIHTRPTVRAMPAVIVELE